MAVQGGDRGGAPGLGLLRDRDDGGAGVLDGLGDPGADRGARLVGGAGGGQAGCQGGLLRPVERLQGVLLGVGRQAGEGVTDLWGEVPVVLDAEAVGGLGGLRPHGVQGRAQTLLRAVREVRGGVPGLGGGLTS
ncbi:hypothetical protein F7Q99_13005 [Streptomyces kaniharaensis]|uniref:Uncharacterized protein n=1 Tax=Streptomyces kaniharaensis TaxID=212423 RepID=A0A6N7KS54_9ACTN|nr:hypothetical protein [Streptomyces kaniharaensis]